MLRRIRQRAFFSFGMDVLLKLDLTETRQFFAAFFALSDYHWQVDIWPVLHTLSCIALTPCMRQCDDTISGTLSLELL